MYDLHDFLGGSVCKIEVRMLKQLADLEMLSRFFTVGMLTC